MTSTGSRGLSLDAPDVTPAPVSSTRPRPFAVVRHSLILAGRAILKIRRTPEQLIDVTLQPILFIVIFVYLFGGAISGSTQDYLQYVLPGLLVQTLLFSAVSIGVNLNTDIEKGIFDRFRSLPIARSAPLIGAVLGDVVRFVVSIVVMVGFGMIIGFRFGTNPVLGILGCVLALVFAMALSWIFVLLGLSVRTPGSVQGIGFLFMFPLTFGSSTFVEASTLPGWLQGWVKVNPVTHLTEGVRGLMLGGPTAAPVTQALLWAAGIVLVFAPLAVRAYRSRA
jgi:oleandomycin transport system permease protein